MEVRVRVESSLPDVELEQWIVSNNKVVLVDPS